MAEFFEGIVAKAVATAGEVFRRQGNAELSSLLASAKPWVDELGGDQFNQYLTHHSLNLEVSVELYASLPEAQIEEAEEAILAKLTAVLRPYRNDALDSVVISPLLDPPMTAVESLPANAADHIWDSGMLRLFISHVSEHKAAVGVLKAYLHVLGVSGFVAHQDIEPSLEWQGEIDLALRTAQAALALLTPEFHSSKWTDQELGVAMARGILVIPVDLGLTPYGFMGRYQALGGRLASPDPLADGIVEILAKRPATVAAMRDGLITALQSAPTYKSAKKVTKTLLAMPRDFTEPQLTRIRAAVAGNDQVGEAIGVPNALAAITG